MCCAAYPSLHPPCAYSTMYFRVTKLFEEQQQELKKEAKLMQQRFDQLEKVMAEITRRLPPDITARRLRHVTIVRRFPQNTDVERDGPTCNQPDGAEDQSDTNSCAIKWSDTDDDLDDGDAGGGRDA